MYLFFFLSIPVLGIIGLIYFSKPHRISNKAFAAGEIKVRRVEESKTRAEALLRFGRQMVEAQAASERTSTVAEESEEAPVQPDNSWWDSVSTVFWIIVLGLIIASLCIAPRLAMLVLWVFPVTGWFIYMLGVCLFDGIEREGVRGFFKGLLFCAIMLALVFAMIYVSSNSPPPTGEYNEQGRWEYRR